MSAVPGYADRPVPLGSYAALATAFNVARPPI
jgi:hypothetical protein